MRQFVGGKFFIGLAAGNIHCILWFQLFHYLSFDLFLIHFFAVYHEFSLVSFAVDVSLK